MSDKHLYLALINTYHEKKCLILSNQTSTNPVVKTLPKHLKFVKKKLPKNDSTNSNKSHKNSTKSVSRTPFKKVIKKL